MQQNSGPYPSPDKSPFKFDSAGASSSQSGAPSTQFPGNHRRIPRPLAFLSSRPQMLAQKRAAQRAEHRARLRDHVATAGRASLQERAQAEASRRASTNRAQQELAELEYTDAELEQLFSNDSELCGQTEEEDMAEMEKEYEEYLWNQYQESQAAQQVQQQFEAHSFFKN